MTLTFSLTVNDGTNADSEAATVDVTVTAGTNDAPTADAGAAQTVAEGAAVTLDGSASSDPEDAALTYTWTQTAPASGKGAGLTLDTSTDQAKPTFTAPTELLNDVTLTFSLTVNDGTNADSEAATVDVTVTAGTNDAPTADAGAAQTVAEGAAVTLDGSASSDPEDAALTYTWTQTAPASGKGAGLTLDTSTDQAKPTFTAPTELLNDVTLTFSLTVNDGTNADSEAATVDVTVTAGTNDAPTADAGAAQTVAEGAAVTLDGSASSDPEDAALTYTWTQTAPASGKGAGLTLDTSTDQAKPTFTAPTELLNDVTLTFSLTVNDGTNADSEAATVDVTVTAGTNDAPTADAGAAQTVAEGAAVTLDGSASSDPEDAALTYTWTQTAPASGKGAGLTLDTSTDQAKPTFTAPTELLNDVTLTFSLTVNDGTNADSEAATVDVTVTAGTNDAPTADAGAAQTVAEGAAVTLDGSASSDPEDAALTYTWTQTAPASGKGAGLTLDTSTDQAKPTFTAPTELLNDVTLTFSLTVNDGTNADSEAATVDVTVTAGTNDAPTADAGAAQTVAEGAAVTLDGSASSDPEDAALTYTWTQTAPASGKGAGLTLDTSTDQAKPTFTAPTELLNDVTLTFSLTVNDGTNADSEAATVDVTVTAGTNDAPTADAGAAQTVAEGAAVTLDGSASSDPEDAALTYTWTQTAPASGKGAGLTLDTSTDQAKPTFTAPTELLNDVTLTFSLTVNDGTNADSEAATVDVTVTAGTNDAPTADAGAAQTVAEGAAVTLDGSASSDPEDAALTYTWTQTAPASGKGAGLTLDTSTDQAKPTFTAPTELLNDVTLTFSLTVNDGTNADSEAATVDVTVTAGTNDAPTADAGAAQTVAEGAAVTLDGSASSDPEDAALTYTWTQTAPASGKGAGLTLDTSTDQAKPTFTAPTELLNDVTLTFSLTVNDGTNADSEAATVDVTVTAGTNDAPTADAGAAQTVAEGAAVTLDGSASSDPEDAALTYTWTQTAPASGKGAGLTLDTSTDQAKPTFTAPTELLNDVTLTFSLTVNDGTNADSEAATVDVTVTAGTNDAPTADAGAAQTVAEGAAVTLDGSASSDPEDAALTYTWTQTAPASGKGAGLTLDTSTDQAKPTFTAPTELLNDVTLTFSLTVNDGTNADSEAATVDVTVTAGTNDAPTADAGAAQTVAEGAAVTLDGSASSDPEDAALTYTWTQTAPASGKGAGLTLDTSTDQAKPTFTAPTELLNDVTLTFSLTVNDGTNADSEAATVDVTVTAGTNDAPTADAGAAQTVAEGAAVTLDGSASSDPEDAALTYTWTQTAPASGKGAGLTLDTSTDQAKPTFTAPTELLNDVTLTFSLTVNDGTNADSEAATVDVTVTAGTNDAPTADAGAAQTVAEGAAVTLDGSASSDPEDAALTYTWTQTAPASGKGAGLTLDTSTDQAKPTFTAPTELLNDVTLTFSLTVNDGTNADSEAATVDVTVTAGTNDAPTADAGAAQTVAEGAAVTLDGSASSDPEDAALTYTWTQTAPASGKGAGLTLDTSTDQAKPTFTAPTELLNDVTLTFSLTVNDGTNADSEAATVDVTVTAGTNDAPTADAGAAQTVAEGAAVTLDGSASSDPEDAALTYTWTQTAPASGKGAGLTLDTSTDQAKPTFTAPTELLNDVTLTFSLTVNDGTNADSEAATVDVTVTAGTNDAPTADAGAAQTVAEGAAVTLDGSASSDPEDAALTYTWTQTAPASGKGAGLTLDTSTDQAKPTFTAPTELLNDVTLTFSLTVNDGTNADSEAATVDVTVTAGTNDAPTADAGAAQTVAEGAAVTLDGSASSDPEDAALTYTWTQTAPASGKGAGLTLDTSTDQAKPTFTAPTELLNDVTLTFSLTVNDGTNADSEAATVDVTVTAGTNDAPTADAGAAQTVAEGAAVTLDGSASSDPEDAALTYTWTQTAPASGKGAGLTLDTSTDQAKPTFTAPTELLNDVTLTFSLTVNDGTNADSEAATVDVTVIAVPSAPSGLTAAAGDAQVTLSWADPGNATIDIYQVSTNGDTSFADIPGSGADTASHTVTSLTNGTEYTFALRAVNGSGDGAAATVSATPVGNNPPRRAKSIADLIAELIADGVLTVGTTLDVDISDTFDDQDADDTLSYTAISNAPAALTVAMSEAMLTLTGMAPGTATVTVTASDGTDSVDDTFTLAVAEADTLQLKVSFAQAVYEIKEGQQADIEVKMSPTTDRRVEVPLVVSLKGGATDEDYRRIPASAVFKEGENQRMISVEVVMDEVNDPGEGIVLSFGGLPEAVSAGDPSSTQVHFRQRRSAEQFSQTLEVMEAVIARSMGESVQTAIEGRFELYRQWSRLAPSVGAMPTPRPESDNRAATPGPGESERTDSDGAGGSGRGAEGSVVQSASGAAKTSAATESGLNSENQGTGTPGSWLRSLSLGSLGNVVGSGQTHLGASPGSGMEPSGRVYGQDRLYGSGVEDPLLESDSGDFSGMRDLRLSLSEVSFEMSPGESEKETSWVPVLWGQGNLQHFSGDLSRIGMNYRGGLEAAHLGLDLYADEQILTGLSFMRSWGDLHYTDDGVDGVLESDLNTVHPYLYWQLNERMSVWGIGGLGTGQVEVREPGRTHDFDADFRMLAGGVRAVLSRQGNNEWGLRADSFTAQLETDASEDIAKGSGEAHRRRLMLESVHDRELSVGRSLSVQAEAGGRFDEGDAERGAGVETGVRLGYLDANSGLDVALHGRVLAVHESDYRDWGVGLQASWDPGEKQRGFRASVMSSWGQDGGGRTTLWNNADAVMRPAGVGIGSQSQIESEVAYAGMKAPGIPGLLTPYGRLRWTGQGQELAWGTSWNLAENRRSALPLTIELEGLRRESMTGPADLAVVLRVSIPLGGSQDVIPGGGRVSARAPDPNLIPRGIAESGADGPQATTATTKPPAEPVSAAQQDANPPSEPATPEPASPASQSAQASAQAQGAAPPSTTTAPARGEARVVNDQPTPQPRSEASPTQSAELQAHATLPQLEPRRQSPPAVTSSVGPTPTVLRSGGVVVQVGAFRSAERAARITDELRQKGHAAITIIGSDYYRVVVGPLPSWSDAAGAQSQLEQQGYKGFLRADLVPAPLPVTDTRRIGP